MPRSPLNIPPRLIVLDAIGTVLAGIGLAGLFTDVSGLLPFLAERDVAGAITALGFALITFSLGKILRHIKQNSAAPPANSMRE